MTRRPPARTAMSRSIILRPRDWSAGKIIQNQVRRPSSWGLSSPDLFKWILTMFDVFFQVVVFADILVSFTADNRREGGPDKSPDAHRLRGGRLIHY